MTRTRASARGVADVRCTARPRAPPAAARYGDIAQPANHGTLNTSVPTLRCKRTSLVLCAVGCWHRLQREEESETEDGTPPCLATAEWAVGDSG